MLNRVLVAALVLLLISPALVVPNEPTQPVTSHDDVKDITTVSTRETEFETYYVRYFYRASYTHPGKKKAPPEPKSVLFKMKEAHSDRKEWDEVNRVYFKYGSNRRNYPVLRYEVSSSDTAGFSAHLETIYFRIPVEDYMAITSSKSFICQINDKNYTFQGEYLTALKKLADTILIPKKKS